MGLYGSLIGCLYYWAFTVSKQIKDIMCPDRFVTSLVASLVSIQSFMVWCTIVDDVEGRGGGVACRCYGVHMVDHEIMAQ